MNEEIPTRREIVYATCTTDGKNKSKENLTDDICPNHMFLVISSKSYNEKTECLLAVALTSVKDNKEDNYIINYGIDINNDDIKEDSGQFQLKLKTVILCDRPSRISKKDLVPFAQDKVMINKEKYEEILNAVTRFIKENKIR